MCSEKTARRFGIQITGRFAFPYGMEFTTVGNEKLYPYRNRIPQGYIRLPNRSYVTMASKSILETYLP
jgi:hypothetical protein